MGIDFDSKPTYGDVDKYTKTKNKTYEDSMTTNFYNGKGPKNTRRKNTNQVFINNNARFVLYVYEKYHPQTFLEEYKYKQQK